MSAPTVADLKQHLNIDGTEDDALLGVYLGAAVDWCNGFVSDPAAASSALFKQAVMMLAGSYYEQREATAPSSAFTVPFGVTDTLTPLRSWVF